MGDIYIPNVHYWEGVYVLLAWCLFLWILSRSSGWTKLAHDYPVSDGQLDDVDFKGWQFAQIGGVPYFGCLWVGVAEQGLFLKTGPDILLRIAHPPIFIPWSAVLSARSSHALNRNMLELSVTGSPIRLRLPEKALKAVEGRLPPIMAMASAT